MAGNSREGWVGRARSYPRCSWPGEKDRADTVRLLFPSDRGNLRPWRGQVGP